MKPLTLGDVFGSIGLLVILLPVINHPDVSDLVLVPAKLLGLIFLVSIMFRRPDSDARD